MSSSAAPRLSFENVSRSFGDLLAVDDLTLSVAPGEVVCLLGPSGCGKTTTLRVAAGVEQQSAGRVFIDEIEVAGPTCFVPPEERSVGLIFQDYALFPHLTVVENVAFGLRNLQKTRRVARAMLELDRVGMADYAETYPHTLSGGEQQRVALARALAPEPSIMLMDEPFSGLDRRLRDRVRDESLALLKSVGASSLIVTHDPEEAMRMGDRIALMRRGKLVQLGTPEDFYRRPSDVEAALFFTDFNILPGRLEAKSVVTAVGSLPRPTDMQAGQAEVLLRPEDLFLLTETAPADTISFGATVIRARLLGADSLIEVAVPELEDPLEARLRGPSGLGPGDRVTLGFLPASCLVFPARDIASSDTGNVETGQVAGAGHL